MLIKNIFLFFLISIFILNPYTVFGPLVIYLLPLLIIPLYFQFKFLGSDTLLLCFVLIMISTIGVCSSFFHGIGQFIHLKVAISIFISILIVYALFFLFRNFGLGFNDFLYFSLLAIFLNSLLILIEVNFPVVRSFVESFLVPSGNVNWEQGLRYRGIASSGGASLSLTIPVALVLALHLYSEKYLGLSLLLVIAFVLVFSLFFIGRTGLVLVPLVLASFVIFNLKKSFIKFLFLVLFFVVSTFLIVGELKYFIIDSYGEGFYKYSLGFLFDGSEGLQDEGTVDTIIGFLKVLPVSFPEIVIGFGFYGDSDFYPWTDSGYSRMFLSVGYFFGVIFYVTFFLIFRNGIFLKKFLFLTIGILLLIAETKEVLLFSGYSSRVFISIIMFSIFERKMSKLSRFKSENNVSTPSFRSGTF